MLTPPHQFFLYLAPAHVERFTVSCMRHFLKLYLITLFVALPHIIVIFSRKPYCCLDLPCFKGVLPPHIFSSEYSVLHSGQQIIKAGKNAITKESIMLHVLIKQKLQRFNFNIIYLFHSFTRQTIKKSKLPLVFMIFSLYVINCIFCIGKSIYVKIFNICFNIWYFLYNLF